MPFSLQERINIVENYIRTGSFKKTLEIFASKFPFSKIPAKSSIQKLISKWRTTGSVVNAKKCRVPTVRTPEAIAVIEEKILTSPTKSVRKLAQQSGMKRTSCLRILHSLNLKPYRVTCVQELKEPDKEKRVNYCHWLLNKIVDGELDPFQYFMSDEAWFHLSGHINSQNTRHWCTENPHKLHEKPLHDPKIGVWCAVSGNGIVGPIFFDTNVNTEVYLRVFDEFYAQLTSYQREYSFFQQDGATCHTSHVSLAHIHNVFTEEKTVSKGLWPPRSPDLSTCDFFLWGYLKGVVYKTNPHTLEELKDNIQTAIQAIDVNVLRNVYFNMITRALKCIDVHGDHFQHLL
jgi:hypothetical protein